MGSKTRKIARNSFGSGVLKQNAVWVARLSYLKFNLCIPYFSILQTNGLTAFIQWCECYERYDWSLSVIYKSTDTWLTYGKLLFFVLFNMARGFENAYEIISDLSKWKPRKKISRSYLQRKKNGETETKFKRALHNLRMPKLQEIFTTVAIVCHRYETRCFAKSFRHFSALSKKRRSKKLHVHK